jgi:hypothetical protein
MTPLLVPIVQCVSTYAVDQVLAIGGDGQRRCQVGR